MNFSGYEIFSLSLSIVILIGIKLMSSPKTAMQGNRLGAIAMLAAIVLVLVYNEIISLPILWIAMVLGGIIGYVLAVKVAMIQMPQMVSLLNGLGGGASALVALVLIFDGNAQTGFFSQFSSQLALAVGGVTFSGSLIAAAKLDRRLHQQPITFKGHSFFTLTCLVILVLLIIVGAIVVNFESITTITLIILLLSLAYGILFAIRVGGADMPITISLLNSYSGLAAAICGWAIAEPLLVSVGAIVGASGIILTQIMCKAMNRPLSDVLNGSTLTAVSNNGQDKVQTEKSLQQPEVEEQEMDPVCLLKNSKKVIVVPGYGMALAQAQHQVKRLADILEAEGKDVSFAIHPVAGRMPGHMNVLLAEVDIPYEKLKEMDEVNPEFIETDVAIVIGACDVVNPAAISAEGTPIYGMPILRVDEAKNVIVCNLDTKPGYSGVENPLYQQPNVLLLLGNATETIEQLADGLESSRS